MRDALRKPSTWFLILALILLAIGVLWLLPRLLEPPPPPKTNIASAEPAEGSDGELEGPGAGPGSDEGAKTADVDPSATAATSAEDARAASSDAGEPADSLAAPGRISGRVVDPAGYGVPGATVLAAHALDLGAPIESSAWWITQLRLDVADPIALGAEAPVRATTNENGFFGFEDFEPGRVRLAVRSETHDPVDLDDLWLPAGGEISLPKLRVERATFLSGRVFDPDDRTVVGVPVVRVDDFAQEGLPPLSPTAGVLLGVTNGLGYFRSIPMGEGPWSVAISGGRELVDARIATSSVDEGWEFEATLAEAAKIRGRVRSASRFSRPMVVRALPASFQPPGFASIPFACRGDARVAEVLSNTEFELSGLRPDVVYELRASESQRPWEVDSSWSPPVLAVAGEERAELLWDPDASVTFRIVAPGTRQPLGECLATLQGFDPEMQSVAAPTEATFGLSALDGLRPKRQSSLRGLGLSKEGYLSTYLDLEDLRPGKMLPLGDVELTQVPTIHVRVVDAITDRAIEGARVFAVETPIEFGDPDFAFEARTDTAGRTRIRSFGGAGSGIEVRAPGYAPARRRGPFGAGFSEASLTIGVRHGATARVRVVDSAGDPVPTARIEHVEGNWSPNESWGESKPLEIRGRPDPRASRVADERGSAEFRHLAPGRHAFRLQRYRAYADSEWTLRELAEGDDDEVVLVTQAAATLEARIHDGGAAIAGAPTALVRREDVEDPLALLDPTTPLPPCISAKLDNRGSASFSNLAPGSYVLLVRVPGQDVRGCWDVEVKEGGDRREIDLARRAIVGTVSHTETGALAGVEIRLALWNPPASRRSRSRMSLFGYGGGADPLATGFDIRATSTDESGAYRILGLPEGVQFLVTARSGEHWRRGSGPIQLKAGEPETRADLSVVQAGAIEVRVGTGPRIVPCVLAAIPGDPRSRPRTVQTFSGGIEVFEALQPGSWEVVVDAGGGGVRTVSVEVSAGETAIVELALP